MENSTIESIYAANAAAREKLKELISSLTEEELHTLPEGEGWTAAQILEHIAHVNASTLRICTKLLSKSAESELAVSAASLSEGFREKGVQIAAMKVEAPEIVQPNKGLSVSESLAQLDENMSGFEELRPMFETRDASAARFPHPFFGEITAHEWLALAGGHELRHIKQMRKVASKVGE